MHWEVLIIPLIALGVWILGTLFKGEDDKTKKGARRPGMGSARPPGRRPTTDLDQFLEEARRRREVEERRKPPPPPQPVRAPSARQPLRERPAQPRPTPERELPAPRARIEEVPVAIPGARPSVPFEVAEDVRVALPPSPTPTTTRDAPPSPIVQQVRSLLSKPQSAGAAFALREIFDRPLCKRRR